MSAPNFLTIELHSSEGQPKVSEASYIAKGSKRLALQSSGSQRWLRHRPSREPFGPALGASNARDAGELDGEK